MKKVKISLAAIAFAVGIAGAFAFGPTPDKAEAKVGQTNLHWFDALTGTYEGQRSSADEQQRCGQPLQIECSNGYSSIDENGDPQGAIQYVTLRANN